MRQVEIVRGFTKYAAGSVLYKQGNTWVLCTASVEEKVPPFKRDSGEGWITAEYAMTFLVSYSFFAFCCSRRDVSRCKHCSTAKGAQVPAGLSFLLAGGGPWCVCVVDSVMDSPKPPQIPFIISVQPAPAVPLQAFQWTVPVGLLRPAILVEPLTVSSEASRVWSLCFLFLQRLCCHWE